MRPSKGEGTLRLIRDGDRLIFQVENPSERHDLEKVLELQHSTAFVQGYVTIEANGFHQMTINRVQRSYSALQREIQGLRQAYEGE
jgi:hypothetical protein